MKDSQQMDRPAVFDIKYIKESNERFSTCGVAFGYAC